MNLRMIQKPADGVTVSVWTATRKQGTVTLRPETFGERLRRLRLARGWTQVEMAERAGISQPCAKRIEYGGASYPGTTAHVLAGLACAFDVTMDYLWSGRDES